MAITLNLYYTGEDGAARAFAALREKYDLRMRAERYVSADLPKTDSQFLRK